LPPLDENCAKILITPKIKTENNKVKSMLKNFSLKENGVLIDALL
jgi:hypothetical protein